MPDEVPQDKEQDTNVEKQEIENEEGEEAKDEGLPDEVSERTREQFEKLKKQNSELKKQLENKQEDQQEELPSILDSLRPSQQVNIPPQNYSNLNKKEVEQIKNSFIDKDGYVNTDLLQKELQAANARAKKAEMEAQMTREEVRRFEESRQVREAHEKYPQLDPKSKDFDKDFYDLVKNEMVAQMLRGESDLIGAAKKVSKFFAKKQPQSEPEDKQKEKKKQINATAKTADRGNQYTDMDLVQATRQNVKGALAERLKRAGY